MEEKKDLTDEERAALMEEALEMFRTQMLPALARGMMKGVFELDEESRNIVLKQIGKACAEFIRKRHLERDGLEFPKGTMDFEKAMEYLNEAVPHKRTHEAMGDEILLKTHMKEAYGMCICPLVILGVVEPTEGHCVCSSAFFKDNIEYLTGDEFDVDMVQTIRMGDSEACEFKVRCRGSCNRSD